MKARDTLCSRPIIGVGAMATLVFGLAAAPEIRWQPISATGSSFTIVDNEENTGTPSEISLDAAGADVVITLELHVSGWGSAPGTPALGAYQGTVDSSGYSNGVGADLGPLGGCCPGVECPLDLSGEWGACIDVARSDFVFSGLGPIAAVVVVPLDYEFGATQFQDGAVDEGGVYYGGTLLLEVPADAGGTYEVGWNPAETKTFLNKSDGAKLPFWFNTPVLIKVPVVCGMDNVVAVDPPSCAVDAREPHDLDDAGTKFGWTELVLTFDCDPTGMNLQPADFGVSMVPFGVAPFISSVVTDGVSQTVTVTLDQSIKPGHWTCITHPDSGKEWCMGYLPGDANQSLQSTSADIIALIDSVNEVSPLPEYAVEINRSGAVNAQDILREIDLLNGAGDFAVWLNALLPPCPE